MELILWSIFVLWMIMCFLGLIVAGKSPPPSPTQWEDEERIKTPDRS